jgi:hypothetical protein
MMTVNRSSQLKWGQSPLTGLVVGLTLLIGSCTGGANLAPSAHEITRSSHPHKPLGRFEVSPRSGPIGTTLYLRGRGCGTPGMQKTLVWASAFLHGSFGSLDVGFVPEARFSLRYRIPAMAHEFNGAGGGPLRPGDVLLFDAGGWCRKVHFHVTKRSF